MGKLLFFAVVGLAVYYIMWRGAKARNQEIATEDDKKGPAETLVYDPKKRAYVPKKKGPKARR